MSGPKPTAGYPSRTAAVEALRARGLKTSAIAAQLGLAPSTVSALECSAARTAAGSRRLGMPPHRSGLVLPLDVSAGLRRAAVLRGWSVDRLALRLLEAIAAEDLVDAVLDDAGGLDG